MKGTSLAEGQARLDTDTSERPTRSVLGEGLPLSSRLWLSLGALNGLLSVAAGAYGRHGALDPAGREMFSIAAQYQIAHALALVGVAWLASRGPGRWFAPANIAGVAFATGIMLFSGSLYWFGMRGLVPIEGAAPTGGFLLMFGWLMLLWMAIRA